MGITIDDLAKEVAEKALDEILYEGKSIRKWFEILVKQQQKMEADEKKQRNSVELVCDIFDEMNRDDQIKVWQYVNEIMEGE